MAQHDDIRAASRRFYEALTAMTNGRTDTMGDVWEQAETVGAMHPIGGHTKGWEAVRASFNQVGGICSGGEIGLQDQQIHVGGDMAYETGIERGSAVMAGRTLAIDQRVTNIYRRLEDGTWRMVHHHSEVSPEMVALLEDLQNEGAAAN